LKIEIAYTGLSPRSPARRPQTAGNGAQVFNLRAQVENLCSILRTRKARPGSIVSLCGNPNEITNYKLPITNQFGDFRGLQFVLN
jgi:hypothetical protein